MTVIMSRGDRRHGKHPQTSVLLNITFTLDIVNMRFTNTMLALLFTFVLASVTYAQTDIASADADQVATTTVQQARTFTVSIDQADKMLSIQFDMFDDAPATIEVCSESGSFTQTLDEKTLEAGTHNRKFFIPHLEDGKYYCVIKSGSWVGAHGFMVEPTPITMEPILF
jgi:biopolymer transport protein ExbD